MAMTSVFTGANGTITLADETSPEGADAKAIQDAYELKTVGRVRGVEVTIQTEIGEYYELGRRHATSLNPEGVHIKGRVERAYVNGALLFLLVGRGAAATNIAEPYVPPTFNMSILLNDPAIPGNSAALELKGVKFDTWRFSLPENDFVLENLTFKALTISVVDKEAPAGGGQGTAKTPKFPTPK